MLDSHVWNIDNYPCGDCFCRNTAWNCPQQLSAIARWHSRDAQANPKEASGAGELTPPSQHQTYWDVFRGRWVLASPQDGKIWRRMNNRAK